MNHVSNRAWNHVGIGHSNWLQSDFVNDLIKGIDMPVKAFMGILWVVSQGLFAAAGNDERSSCKSNIFSIFFETIF